MWRSGPRAPARSALRDGDLVAVGIGDPEVARAPRLRDRVVIQGAAVRLDVGGELVDVLRGVAVEADALALHAVLPLREVVLSQVDRAGAGAHFGADQPAVAHPRLFDDEAEDLGVPVDR